MKKILVLIIILMLSAVYVSGLTGPINQNGKQYYVVNSADSSEDTGDEVCAKAGLSCIGYTETTDAVCKQAHPTASSVSGFSGDESGVYCNGAPQNGVCATESNACVTCPSCSVTLECDEPIGGLYKEMYVECSAGQCKINMQANNVQDLLNQISGINSQLQGCPQAIPSFAKILAKNGITRVDINMNNGQTQSLTINMNNGQVTGVSSGAPASCSQKITVSENDLNTALQSSNPSQAYAYLYGQGKMKVSGCTIFKKVGFFFANLFGKPAAKKAAPAMPPPKPAPNCGQIGEQCNNRGCLSGICGAPKEQNSNGQWGFWNHRCLDQTDYNNYCVGRGNTPPAWQCYTGVCK